MQRFLIELTNAKRWADMHWKDNNGAISYIREIYEGLINAYLSGELLSEDEFLDTLLQADVSIAPLWMTYRLYASEELYVRKNSNNFIPNRKFNVIYS